LSNQRNGEWTLRAARLLGLTCVLEPPPQYTRAC
jgi:hypothetical protein